MRNNRTQVKKRILIITSYTKPINMGVGSNAEAFADFLNKEGYSAKVLSKTNTGFIEKTTKKIAVRWPNSKLLKTISLLWVFPYSLYLCASNSSIFFISNHFPLMPLMMLFSNAIGKQTVFRSSLIGDDDPLTIAERGSWYSKINLFAIKQANVFHSINPAFTESYIKTFNTKKNVVETTQGVDTSTFTFKLKKHKEDICKKLNVNPEIPIILSVGFLINRKGFKEMFETLAEIKHDFTYLIVGDYKLPTNHPLYYLNQEMYENYCIGSNLLQSKVRFMGSVADIKKIYAIADVLLMNSYAEGTPNVLLEAMSSGVVPIVRELEGYRDFLIQDNTTGVLFSSHNEALDALNKFIEEPFRINEVSKKVAAFAKDQFSFDKTWDSINQKLN